jgi:hypothetical protein
MTSAGYLVGATGIEPVTPTMSRLLPYPKALKSLAFASDCLVGFWLKFRFRSRLPGFANRRALPMRFPLNATLIAGAVCLALTGCTDDQATRDAAGASGLTEVKTTGYSVFGCGKEDSFATGFTARGMDGRCVEGVVCSGWLKGATLRITGQSKACPPTTTGRN